MEDEEEEVLKRNVESFRLRKVNTLAEEGYSTDEEEFSSEAKSEGGGCVIAQTGSLCSVSSVSNIVSSPTTGPDRKKEEEFSSKAECEGGGA